LNKFVYQKLLPIGEDSTPYRHLTSNFVSTGYFEGKEILKIEMEGLTQLADQAIRDSAHLLRPGHLAQLRDILNDPESSDNDRFVAFEMLKNANIASGGILPMCQDTGTIIMMGKKGQQVWTEGDDEEALSLGAMNAFLKTNLRYSQQAPLDMFSESNTRNNLPAQIEIYSDQGNEYKLMIMTKGGGSANKSMLFQETRALLTPERFLIFIEEKLRLLGTAACPPYHLGIVVGGTSAEYSLKVAKLASARFLDTLPTHGNELGRSFRDLEMESLVLKMSQDIGIGAQFGGKYFCHDVRVIRMPRHGASCPVAMAVSCAADRQILSKITREGIFLEQLETEPSKYLPKIEDQNLGKEVVKIDLNQPMSEIRETLSRYPVATRLSLTGPMVVARDIAHAKLKERLDRGEKLPQYFKDLCVYYAGPAKTPDGYASGSFGPTTAGRMDTYVDEFQKAGGSMIMVAKGNRSAQVTNACKNNGGFYLGSIGGPAARLAKDSISTVSVVEYPELGMEAIWKIEVKDFPAFIVVDDKGNDFFSGFMVKK
tara:strand:+ start:26669 stop:28291 length:1623 start_codon:yes stop_codon:yes gene_type:complete